MPQHTFKHALQRNIRRVRSISLHGPLGPPDQSPGEAQVQHHPILVPLLAPFGDARVVASVGGRRVDDGQVRDLVLLEVAVEVFLGKRALFRGLRHSGVRGEEWMLIFLLDKAD